MEKLSLFSSRLYYTYINPIEFIVMFNQKLLDPKTLTLWHDNLGHLGTIIMRRIIETFNEHLLKDQTIFFLSNEFLCVVYAQEKMIIISSLTKVEIEFPSFI